MARRARRTGRTTEAGEEVGGFLIRWGYNYYFIPADRVGPPVTTLTKAEVAQVEAHIQKEKAKDGGDYVDGVRIGRKEIIVRCGNS